MNKEQAVSYLRFSGFSDEQIKAIEGAFSCPSAGIDCEDCPAYEKKSEWEHDHEILKAYSDGASAVLDKVRAEIEERKLNSGGEPNRELAFNVCLQIIDGYMTEEDKA